MTLSFDATDPELQRDPYPHYARMREEAPVHFQTAENGFPLWIVSRYEDILTVLRSPELGVEDVPPEGFTPPPPPKALEEVNKIVHAMMLQRDPPDHTRLRGLVSRAFTPRVVERLRSRIEGLVDEILWEHAGGSRMDLIRDLAEPLPVLVIAELLGLPIEDRARLKAWSDDIVPMLDGTLRDEHAGSIFRATMELRDYLADIVEQRRLAPGEDLMSHLIVAQDERDALSDIEIIATSILILGAGHETTTNLIGNGVYALLQHKDQKERLIAEPDLLPGAVEEMLRFDSPVQVTARHPANDYALQGHVIPRGHEVNVLLGSGNRDPEAFHDPDRFDIGRENLRHLSFGQGTHFCMGAQLARLEAQLAIGGLLARRPDIELESPPERRRGFVLRGIKTLAVRLS